MLPRVRRYQRHFERFGEIGFEIRLNEKGKPTECAMLNESPSMLPLAFMRNTLRQSYRT